jgi:methylated-DNA-[protein]-cysteine S-methyltransferase
LVSTDLLVSSDPHPPRSLPGSGSETDGLERAQWLSAVRTAARENWWKANARDGRALDDRLPDGRAAERPPLTTLWLDEVSSPLGPIAIVGTDRALCALDFAPLRASLLERLRARFGPVTLATRRDGGCAGRLHAYFEGALDALDAVLVDPGGTPFQRQVWSALRTIPPGTTVTYTTLAERLGQPRAIRAVGLANSRNPISLVIPCHRVIGAGGHLTGYGGGIWRKRWLLEHEGACGGRAVGNR